MIDVQRAAAWIRLFVHVQTMRCCDPLSTLKRTGSPVRDTLRAGGITSGRHETGNDSAIVTLVDVMIAALFGPSVQGTLAALKRCPLIVGEGMGSGCGCHGALWVEWLPYNTPQLTRSAMNA
jgi:hypothetical protein